MSPAKKPSPTLPAKGSKPDRAGHHTCIRCPACATETCRVLQELGMTCDTACAATEAVADERARRRAHAAA